MITAYTIIMTYITIITFLAFLVLMFFNRQNGAAYKKKLVFVPIGLALLGIIQSLIYGKGDFNSVLIYLAIILVSLLIVRIENRKIKR